MPATFRRTSEPSDFVTISSSPTSVSVLLASFSVMSTPSSGKVSCAPDWRFCKPYKIGKLRIVLRHKHVYLQLFIRALRMPVQHFHIGQHRILDAVRFP